MPVVITSAHTNAQLSRKFFLSVQIFILLWFYYRATQSLPMFMQQLGSVPHRWLERYVTRVFTHLFRMGTMAPTIHKHIDRDFLFGMCVCVYVIEKCEPSSSLLSSLVYGQWQTIRMLTHFYL